MFDRFTERARKVIALAVKRPGAWAMTTSAPSTCLLGLIREGGGVAAAVLENLTVDLERVRLEVEKLVVIGGGTLTLGEVPSRLAPKRCWSSPSKRPSPSRTTTSARSICCWA